MDEKHLNAKGVLLETKKKVGNAIGELERGNDDLEKIERGGEDAMEGKDGLRQS